MENQREKTNQDMMKSQVFVVVVTFALLHHLEIQLFDIFGSSIYYCLSVLNQQLTAALVYAATLTIL
jgi:hypothetical protein